MIARNRNGLSIALAIYGAVFWVMNGADKFLNGTDLGLFRWSGKNRVEQFATYTELIDAAVDLAAPVLLIVGAVEVGMAFLYGTSALRLVRGDRAEALATLRRGTTATIVLFTLFSAFDVVVGDRAELLEHGMFIVVFLAIHVVIATDPGLGGGPPGRSLRLQFDDEPAAPVVGQVVPGPVDQHVGPVAETDQHDEVEGQPRHPAGKAGDLRASR